jgi:4-hydroxy-tetrahydrodipicolinate synthase
MHYTEIAKNTSLPIILYNVPSRTGLNIEPKTCLKLSKIPIMLESEEVNDAHTITKIK